MVQIRNEKGLVVHAPPPAPAVTSDAGPDQTRALVEPGEFEHRQRFEGPDLKGNGPIHEIEAPELLARTQAKKPGAGWVRTGTVVRHNGELVLRDDFTAGEPKRMIRMSPRVDLPEGTIVRTQLEQRGAELRARMIGEPEALADTPRAKMYAIAAQEGMDPEFSPEIRAEVEKILAAPGIDDPTLVDMTDKPFVTIDYEKSKDLDQAVCIEPNESGGYDVYYALADASYYINPDNPALFHEAMQRATSFYMPGLTIPMLPKELSEGIISLNEGEDRRSMVFKLSIDGEGKPIGTDVSRARIHSRKKLTYDGVQEMMDHRAKREAGEVSGKHPLEVEGEKLGFLDSLLLLKPVGETRIKDAMARDVVQFHRTPVDVRINGSDETATFQLVADERNEVEKWNEQVSLLTNIEGALALVASLGDPDLQAVFKVHDDPPERRLRKLEGFISDLVESRGLDPDVWRWDRDGGQSLADYLEGLPTEGELWRTTIAVHRQAVMSNVASMFADEVGGHHGIGAEAYARFSAPMREMVGIFTHKEMIELLWENEGSVHDLRYRELIIEGANLAKKRQRRITKAANKLAIDGERAGGVHGPQARSGRGAYDSFGRRRHDDRRHLPRGRLGPTKSGGRAGRGGCRG